MMDYEDYIVLALMFENLADRKFNEARLAAVGSYDRVELKAAEKIFTEIQEAFQTMANAAEE